MDLAQITPLILTFNEEPNIDRVLGRLGWASSVVVVDSQSIDRTVLLAERHSNVRVVRRQFDNHVSQWNFGLDQVSTEWVMTLDADYVLSESLVEEIRELDAGSTSGFFARFQYWINGKPLRGSLYPPRIVLFRRARATYVDDGHTQLLELDGAAGRLRAPIFHDDRKPLSHWLHSQNRYADLEARKLRATPARMLSRNDRIRKAVWLAPLVTPLYCLVLKGLIFDGRAGWTYTLQRTYAELLLSLKLLETGPAEGGTERA